MCRFASEIPVEEERRSFFRRSMLIFPAIHKVWRRQIALTGKNLLPLGILPFIKQGLISAALKCSSVLRELAGAGGPVRHRCGLPPGVRMNA